MRILVCGGRDFDDWKVVYRVLDRITPRGPADELGNDMPHGVTIIHGAARGADMCADRWAVVNWCEVKEYPADWVRYGKPAGAIRNQKMLDEGKPDLVVAFPGGAGTADMIRRARGAAIPVRQFDAQAREIP